MPEEVSVSRWAIFVDVEGFSVLYPSDHRALDAVSALMEAIYFLGARCFPDQGERIFAHQLGDGILVVSDFPTNSLEQPLSIAVVLMRHVLLGNGTARVAIAEGELSDVVGCYPEVIRRAIDEDRHGVVRLGAGLMTVFPVMGTALINSYGLMEKSGKAKGSLLVVDPAVRSRLPEGVPSMDIGGVLTVDWIHSKFDFLDEVITKGGFPTGNFELRLREYVRDHGIEGPWKDNTFRSSKLEDVDI